MGLVQDEDVVKASMMNEVSGVIELQELTVQLHSCDVRKLFELLQHISILSVDISASVKVSVVYHGIYSWILDTNPHGYEYGSVAKYPWYYPCHCLSVLSL